ncbi:MAG: tetratricopeptide repeat protein [Chitinophagaceae bacterium]|nr:tetratricopeptide repeat protein [Chitinophagaceae bacterium]
MKKKVTKHSVPVKESSLKEKAIKQSPLVKNNSRFSILILIMSGVILYGNTFKHDFTVDDPWLISRNQQVQRGFEGIPDLISKTTFVDIDSIRVATPYRPMSFIAFATEYQFFGNSPHAMHFFNVMYYILAVAVLYLLLKKYLFKSYSFHMPLLISLLFLAHPIHTEVVANIKSRDEIFSLLGFLSTCYFLFKYLDNPKIKYLTFGVLTYFFALLSKENAVTFIAIFPLTLYVFSTSGFVKIAKITGWLLIPLISYFLIRYQFLQNIPHQAIQPINNSLVDIKDDASLFATKIFVAGKYLLLLIFPNNLTWDYSYGSIAPQKLGNLYVLLSLIVNVSLLIFAIVKIRRKSLIAFGILFYFIVYSITSNFFITIDATMAERFMFIPSLGFCIILAVMLMKINSKPNRKLNPSFITLVILILTLYSVKTITRNQDWKDTETLISSEQENSNAVRTQLSYANQMEQLGNTQRDAVTKKEYYNKALMAANKAVNSYPGYSLTHYVLGRTYLNTNDTTLAKSEFLKAIDINKSNIKALNDLGVIYWHEHDMDKSADTYKKITEIDNKNEKAFENLGMIYFFKKDYTNALRMYDITLSLNPNNSLANQYKKIIGEEFQKN